MADAAAPAAAPAGAPAGRGGFGARGDRGGDRGRGRGRGRGRRGGKSEEKEWQPVTKLGRLVKAGKIKSMEEIYLHSLPIKEYQIVDFFLPRLKDEVMKVWLSLPAVGFSPFLDQARPEADSRRSAYSIQGHRRHRRLGGPRRPRHQDVQGSRHCNPRRHHHRQAERHSHSSRILGQQSRRAALSANEAERQVRQRHCPSRCPWTLGACH